MDRNMDNMNNFYGMPPYSYDNTFDASAGDNPMFNPVVQYEQAYMYYRYLTQQMEYKIKCKVNMIISFLKTMINKNV